MTREQNCNIGQVERNKYLSIFVFTYIDYVMGYPFTSYSEISKSSKKFIDIDSNCLLNIDAVITIIANEKSNILVEPQFSISNLQVPQIRWKTPEYLKHFSYQALSN